ncbi:C-type lectin [Operophtera brumata]|uniref:C-type lectin n=1 Tax=Operophtera brumata TaxID=104452 RepID=A0A0L7LC13_OPEBR|nr:C-type lectin [Operophtera brumata]
MSYVCPPHFIRLGHSCYFFSEEQANWHDALFACKTIFGRRASFAMFVVMNIMETLNKVIMQIE